MKETIELLNTLHEYLKNARTKHGELDGGAGYRNGFEDGYKSVTKRVKKYIEDLEATTK